MFQIAIFGHETWPLTKVSEVAHILSFYPRGLQLSLFLVYGSGFWDTGQFSTFPYLGMKLGHWPKIHICCLSTPKGRNWAYFCSTGSGLRDTGWFSKLPYLGMKLGIGPKVQQLHIYSLSTPVEGVDIELIFALWAAVSEIRANVQNCHIWAWNVASRQISRSCTYALFLPKGVEIELIFALLAAVSEIQAKFQNRDIWAEIIATRTDDGQISISWVKQS